MEHRKISTSKPSPLPKAYLKMVTEVFAANFDSGLILFSKHLAEPFFDAQGEVGSNEIILAVSLMNKEQLAATTVYASTDFDPKASTPAVQDLLSACVDAAGLVFSTILSPDKPEVIDQLAHEPLTALENVPFEWTETEADRRRIFVKIDRANLALDSMTDEWLLKHDPEFKQREQEEAKETEKLFFTGPKGINPDDDDSDSGQVH